MADIFAAALEREDIFAETTPIDLSEALDKLDIVDFARQDQQDGVDLDEVRAELDELEAIEAARTIDERPPIPTVTSISPSGIMRISFSGPIQVPANMQDVKNSEVALRSTQSRTETYLTDTGY